MAKCKPTFASQARHQIVIQSKGQVDDGYGGQTVTWNDAYTVRAQIIPSRGRDIFASEQLQSRVDMKVWIRYIAALKDTNTAADHRITYDDRIFNIIAVNNLDRDLKNEGKDFQLLICVDAEPT